MAKKDYRRGKKCPDCGKPITDRARKCKSCVKKSPKTGAGDGSLLRAWRYDCRCGITAYAFQPRPEIQDGRGHRVRRGPRMIYLGGKFHNPCPSCEQHPDDHSYELRDDMFYVALCPSTS